MNITRNQWLQIIGIVLASSVAASALWTQLFGQATASIIISLLGFGNTILAGVTYILTGQTQQVKDVQAMPGVSKITVNDLASPALAAVSEDPANTKVVKGN